MDRSALTLFGDTVTCRKFERASTGLCKHFTEAGYCSLPDELVCIELSKQRVRHLEQVREPKPKPTVQRDLFGEPVALVPERAVATKASAAATKPRTRPAADPALAQPFGLTPDDVARFKGDGIEVLLGTPGGDVWLVPALTTADRQELTVDHLATVVHVASVIPGARLKAVHRGSSRVSAEAVR